MAAHRDRGSAGERIARTRTSNDAASRVVEPAPSDSYWELDAELEPAAEELWGLFCYERGALGAEVLDERGPHRRLRHFFPDTDPAAPTAPSPEAWLAAFRAAYPDAPLPRDVTARLLPAQPWEQAWRVHFTPLRLGRRLLIVPPWAEVDTVGDAPKCVRIVIEPGQGFGTGWHPSTAAALLALEALLDERPPPARLLDVGTGSGILAIAGRLLGVQEAVALDVDAVALPDVRRNFALSGMGAPLGMLRGGPGCLRAPFPLLLANIVSEVLLQLRDDLAGLTAPGGCLILSGILESECAELIEAYAALGLRTTRELRREGWIALRLERT